MTKIKIIDQHSGQIYECPQTATMADMRAHFSQIRYDRFNGNIAARQAAWAKFQAELHKYRYQK